MGKQQQIPVNKISSNNTIIMKKSDYFMKNIAINEKMYEYIIYEDKV